MSEGSADAKRRVKLYTLNASRQWDDKGTGHVTSCHHEPLDGVSLLVRDESNGSLLLESKIQLDTHYQKQQGTLIVWTEGDNYDLALSFQEPDGCNEIWEKICQVQGRDPFEQDNDEVEVDLVECDQDKLQLILEQITAFSQTLRKRDVLASDYVENDYIPKLLNIFRQAEERQDINKLRKLYEIFKELFLYDRATLTEVMLNEQHILDVIGVFEYETLTQLTEDRAKQTQANNNNNLQQDTEQSKENIDLSEDADDDTDANADVDADPDADLVSDADADGDVDADARACADEGDDEALTAAAAVATANAVYDSETSASNATDALDDADVDIDLKQIEQTEDHQSETDSKPQNDNQDETKSHIEAIVQDSRLSEETNTKQQLTEDQLHLILNRKKHREFLQNSTSFKEVIPFCNPCLVDKIHQTYRVQYLQSSVLPAPSILEENAYASLTNILFFNKVEIVTLIQENTDFLQSLFNQIISNETGLERKKELVLFLREYCIFSQTIQPKQRESFFKTLASLKILSAVEVALSSNDQGTKSAAIDILNYLVEYSPHMTREQAVQDREEYEGSPNDVRTTNILKLVIEHITTDEDPELGTATQLACIIKLLFDAENNTLSDGLEQKQRFLDFFYYTCMQSLIEPIQNSTKSNGDIEPSANDRKTAQLLSIMLELLTLFMEHYCIGLRKTIVSRDLLARIITLIKTRHKFLVLSVVRFFRRLVASKDMVYFEMIITEDLFSPIIQVLKNNNGRYNLVDSAILEMFEYIHTEDLLPLIKYVMTNFGPFLDSIDYVETFKIMRQKNEAAVHDVTIRRPRFDFSRYTDTDDASKADHLSNVDDVEDMDDINDVDERGVRELDPDSGDAAIDSDPDVLSVPDMEFTMNGTKNDDDDVDEENEVEDEDEIEMDEDDCDDDLEPQIKKKKTK